MPEPRRQAVHLAGVTFPLLVDLGVLDWGGLRRLLLASTALVVVAEFVRLRSGGRYLSPDWLVRNSERGTVGAYTLYLVGVSVVSLTVPPAYGLPAMYVLALQDGLSGLTYGYVPDHRLKAAVSFVTAVAVLLVFVPLVVALATGVVATILDGSGRWFDRLPVSDNLLIPIGCALSLWFTVPLV